MEITLVWSWFSFILGLISAVVATVVVLFAIAFKQWKKQKAMKNDVESAFQAWAGRDNK